MSSPTDPHSPQRRFARKTWGSLGVERECAIAEAIAELYPDGIPDDPDLTAIEVAATRRLESRPRTCNERLYEHGQLVAICSQPWGTEHSHCDHSATEAIQLGLAVGTDPGDAGEEAASR